MDINALMKQMLSSDSIQNLSSVTGTTQKDVKNVLSTALPSLLNGAQSQATDEKTAESFVNALASHAKDDTADISSFFSNIDLEDGGKIVQHLLGNQTQALTEEAAGKAGVEDKKSTNILSAAAPLLMSLLGQQTAGNANNNTSGIGGLMGSLLGGVDFSSLLGGIFGGGSEEEEKPAETQPLTNNNTQSAKKPGLLDTILGFFRGK